MLFKLSKENFNFLKSNIPYAFELVDNIQNTSDDILFNVENVGDFQNEITMEIVDSGMDNEDTVNKKGIKMYEIYDVILYQKRNSA